MSEHASVLVAYATADGSTHGVAEAIAEELRRAGLVVRCCPAGPEPDWSEFDAVVVGSAIHDGHWLASALESLAGAATKGDAPVWCFSVGSINPRRAPGRWLARQELASIARDFPAGFACRDHQLFAGVVTRDRVPWYGMAFLRLVGGHPGDQRDWTAIRAWGREIAADLAAFSDAEEGAL
jgi:menaquinone-dependent protoporphyrinogen oxidase